MTRTQGWQRLLILPVMLLTGCATMACDPDDPKFGKDCYECGRKARAESHQDDPPMRVINERTEECLRERGYVKQKPAN